MAPPVLPPPSPSLSQALSAFHHARGALPPWAQLWVRGGGAQPSGGVHEECAVRLAVAGGGAMKVVPVCCVGETVAAVIEIGEEALRVCWDVGGRRFVGEGGGVVAVGRVGGEDGCGVAFLKGNDGEIEGGWIMEGVKERPSEDCAEMDVGEGEEEEEEEGDARAGCGWFQGDFGGGGSVLDLARIGKGVEKICGWYAGEMWCVGKGDAVREEVIKRRWRLYLEDDEEKGDGACEDEGASDGNRGKGGELTIDTEEVEGLNASAGIAPSRAKVVEGGPSGSKSAGAGAGRGVSRGGVRKRGQRRGLGIDALADAAQDARAERRRERNRASAAQANSRRKEYIQKLRRDLCEVRECVDGLRKKEAGLRSENKILRLRMDYTLKMRGLKGEGGFLRADGGDLEVNGAGGAGSAAGAKAGEAAAGTRNGGNVASVVDKWGASGGFGGVRKETTVGGAAATDTPTTKRDAAATANPSGTEKAASGEAVDRSEPMQRNGAVVSSSWASADGVSPAPSQAQARNTPQPSAGLAPVRGADPGGLPASTATPSAETTNRD